MCSLFTSQISSRYITKLITLFMIIECSFKYSLVLPEVNSYSSMSLQYLNADTLSAPKVSITWIQIGYVQTAMKTRNSHTWMVSPDLIELFVHDTAGLESKITIPFLRCDFLHYLSTAVRDPSQMMVHFIRDGGSYMTLVNSLSHQSDTKLW